MTTVEISPAFSQSKFLEKAFDLPLISDTCSFGIEKMSPVTSLDLQPTLTSLSPVVASHLAHLKRLGEDRLPEVLSTKLTSARDQAASCVLSLDSTLCSGLDQLLDKVPALRSSTPALYSSTREAVVSQLTLASTYLASTTTQATNYLSTTTSRATTTLVTTTSQATTYLASTTSQATTYLASFTLGQLALKVCDSGLETAESLLKLAPASCSLQCLPLVSGLKTVRSKAADIGREGARSNEKVAALEESSLASALSQVLGLYYVLELFGLSEVLARAEVAADLSKKESAEKVEAAEGVVEEVLADLSVKLEVVEN